MKRLLFFLGFLAALSTQAQNALMLSNDQGHPGDTVTLTLSLTNSDAVTAMQAFIPLGNQLAYVSGSAAITARGNGHQLSASVLRDTLRIYSYSLGLNAYTGNSGALVTLDVTANNEFTCLAVIALRNIMFSNLEGKEVPLDDDDCTVTVTAMGFPGDVDGDGHISIADVVCLIDYLLNNSSDTFVLGNADADGDGHITIADATAIIDYILSH